MLRNIYGFTDSGKKVKVGEYDDGLKAVGGRIFYIDPNSDETVEFYDASGNTIQNIDVGDTPVYYKVTSAGVSGKDKFYVYREDVYTTKVWTYSADGNWVYELSRPIDYNDRVIGAGKTNTARIMALHDGAYITNNARGYTTIWYAIQQCRLTQLGGCSDWFVGSPAEHNFLRIFIDNNISTLGLVDLFTNKLWSSSEDDAASARSWIGSTWNSLDKGDRFGVIPIRSF